MVCDWCRHLKSSFCCVWDHGITPPSKGNSDLAHVQYLDTPVLLATRGAEEGLPDVDSVGDVGKKGLRI